MIKIEESTPRKLSGRTSLLITFPFNQGVIDVIKALPTYVYHKKDRAWECPISNLARLVDSLTKIDDIELTLIPDEAKSEKSPTDLTEEEISKFKIRPLRHQIEAINYGLAENHSKWLLCDGMGCGKTCESIYLAETLYRRGKIKHCLIICGVDSLRSN